jgi:hypothetical protein
MTSARCQVPIANGLVNFFRAAMTESVVKRPVRGLSGGGMFSISIDKTGGVSLDVYPVGVAG